MDSPRSCLADLTTDRYTALEAELFFTPNHGGNMDGYLWIDA